MPCKNGVIVLVDATALGGDTDVRCVASDPATGLDATNKAGFEYSFVPRYPGWVCQVDRQPSPCNGAPSDAYWSYWYAKDGAWQYSNRGASGDDPDPGEMRAWVFGASDAPSISVAKARQDAPVISPTEKHSEPGVAGWPVGAALLAALVCLGVWVRFRRRVSRRRAS